MWITLTDSSALGGFGWLFVAMWASGCLVALAVLLWPFELHVDADSFTTHVWGRQRRYTFVACSEFDTMTVRGTTRVVFDHPHERPPSWFRRLDDRLAGRNHAIPDTFGLPAGALAELLNERRRNVFSA